MSPGKQTLKLPFFGSPSRWQARPWLKGEARRRTSSRLIRFTKPMRAHQTHVSDESSSPMVIA